MSLRLLECWGSVITMRVSYPSTAFLIVLISSIICVLPLYNQYSDEVKDLIITDLFETRFFQDSLLISSVIGFPMMFDVVLDSFALSRTTVAEKIHWTTRLLLLLSLMLPSSFLYYRITGDQLSVQSYVSATALMNVTSRGCICIFLSQDHHKIGIGGVCISICICYAAVEVLWLMNYYRGDELIIKISLGFTAITWLQLLYIFLKWRIKWKTSGRAKNSDDVCITLYLASLCLLSVGNLLVSLISNDPTQVHPDLRRTSLTIYLQILFTVTSMTVSSRVARFNLQKTASTMDERQAFVRYISHELRTPLNAVFLGMNFIKEELKIITPLQKESIGRIVDTVEDVNNCCEIAISILNDLLTFDKLEEGKMMLDFEETAIKQYVTDAVRPFRVEARQKNIEISINVVEDNSGWEIFTALRVDRHKMSQVIRNLLSNAIKFTPPYGSVTINMARISRGNGASLQQKRGSLLHSLRFMGNSIVPLAHDCPHPSPLDFVDYLRIEVIDNGAGISIDNQGKLFGQYVQFNAGKLQKGNGSGLGLWISKGIVELHGGYIGAFSAGEGMGSTFFVELPLYPKGTDPYSEKSFLKRSTTKSNRRRAMSERLHRRSLSRSVSSRRSERPLRRSFVDDAHGLFEFTNRLQHQISSAVMRDDMRSCKSMSFKQDSVINANLEYQKEGIIRSASATVIIHSPVINDDIELPSRVIKVLVVDDSPATRKIMMRILINKGYVVHTAQDGIECLRIVNEGIKNGEADYSLIIMDDCMPNLSGPATAKLLRVNNYTGIICGVTGNTSIADISNFKNHGATLVLPKPLNIGLLDGIVKGHEM